MSTAETYGFWIAIAFAAVVWFLPTIIAMVRGLDGGDILIVLTLNLIGVGWPAAMIGAFFPKDRLPPDRGPNPYYNPYWRYPPRPAGWVPPTRGGVRRGTRAHLSPSNSAIATLKDEPGDYHTAWVPFARSRFPGAQDL